MDAVEYVKTKYRLCRSKDSCFECPLQDKENCGCITDTIGYVEKAVQIVEQWAKDHPVKTRQSEFLKLFPNAKIYNDVIWLCPKYIGCDYKPEEDCNEISCFDCKREFWLAEVTDND